MAELSEFFQSAREIPMRRDDYLPGYRWSYNMNEEKYNAAATFYDLSDDQLKRLLPAIEECAPKIDAAFGTPWRIVNTRVYSTIGSKASVFDGGQNTWHTDKFNSGILKILLYLSPVGDQYGATEIRMPDGSTFITKGGPGTYLLFDPTKLIHRGLPANGGRRDTIELVIAAASRVSKRAVQAGQNGVYPWFPWTNPATE